MARLAEELTLVAAQHGSGLTEVGVLGAFVLVLGQIAGIIVRDGRADLESLTASLGRQLRDATLAECARRSYLQ